jgi:murein DD-endopeptidase MepM/ murein hydrolase activator NlpD
LLSTVIRLKIIVIAKGIVSKTGFEKKGMGNYIILRHSEEYSTFCSHLKSISVKPVDKTEKVLLIGYAGSTVKSIGPHLHYEVIKNGKHLDPNDYLPK